MNKSKIFLTAIALIAFVLFQLNVYAQGNNASSIKEVKIKTSAQCNMCKSTIEKALNKTKGVTKADLKVDTKLLTVSYDSKLTDPDKIRKVVNNSGYDADDKSADAKAYSKLSGCCKKPTK